MRLYTVKSENGQLRRTDGIELVEADGRLYLGVKTEEGVEGVPLSTYFSNAIKWAPSRRLGHAVAAITDGGERVLTHWEPQMDRQEQDYSVAVLFEVGGQLASSMFIDTLVDGRVVREQLPPEPENMAGVELLGSAPGKFLVYLAPGASFRLEDIPGLGSLSIRWPGWDKPRPKQVDREYLLRRTGLQLRTYAQPKKREPPLGLVAEG